MDRKKVLRLMDAGFGQLLPLAIMIACFGKSFTFLQRYPLWVLNFRDKAFFPNFRVLSIVWGFVSWFKLGFFTHDKTSSADYVTLLLL